MIYFESTFMLNTLESIFRCVRSIGLLINPLKYYRNDPPGYTPTAFVSVLSSIRSTRTELSDTHWVLHCARNREIRTTEVYLKNAFNPDKPSLIFHHPSGETNHAFAYDFILGSEITRHANIFLIKAQHHTSTNDFLSHCVDTFLHHQLTFAGSVLAVEAIVQFHKKHAKTQIVVSGASMGGIVSSLHAYFFGTADWYIPLAAYPNVGRIFMGRSYAFGISDWRHKRTNAAYLDSFHLKKPFPHSVSKRITPILGTKDTIVLFSEARAFWTRHDVPFVTYPYGHFTPAIMRNDIRAYILEKLS